MRFYCPKEPYLKIQIHPGEPTANPRIRFNRVMAEFMAGVLETDDPATIKILSSHSLVICEDDPHFAVRMMKDGADVTPEWMESEVERRVAAKLAERKVPIGG